MNNDDEEWIRKISSNMQDGAITTRPMSCLGVDKYDFKGRKKKQFLFYFFCYFLLQNHQYCAEHG